MAKIGIIGAMDLEVEEIIAATEVNEEKLKAGMKFCAGKIGNTEVVVVKCGVGKVNAAMCAQILIDDFSVTHVINTGVAGSLNNDINVGDIVVCVDAVQHDMDAMSLGMKKGEIPFVGKDLFLADELLRQKAVHAIGEILTDIKAVEGRVCTGDQFIADRSKKHAIAEDFSGDCVEMEGASIAQCCFLNDVPFLILRAISDKADDSGKTSFFEFAKLAAARSAKLVIYMIKNW